jgi:hypothetical protein
MEKAEPENIQLKLHPKNPEGRKKDSRRGYYQKDSFFIINEFVSFL